MSLCWHPKGGQKSYQIVQKGGYLPDGCDMSKYYPIERNLQKKYQREGYPRPKDLSCNVLEVDLVKCVNPSDDINCQNGQTYVMKTECFDDENHKDAWIKEVEIHVIMNQYHVGPRLENFWVCSGKGYIVMEKMDGDILALGEEVIEKRVQAAKKIVNDQERYRAKDKLNSMINRIQISLFKQIDTIHQIKTGKPLKGYCHCDIHLKNVFFKEENDGSIKVTLADFGEAVIRDDLLHVDPNQHKCRTDNYVCRDDDDFIKNIVTILDMFRGEIKRIK